jgi:hypothetical protein
MLWFEQSVGQIYPRKVFLKGNDLRGIQVIDIPPFDSEKFRGSGLLIIYTAKFLGSYLKH